MKRSIITALVLAVVASACASDDAGDNGDTTTSGPPDTTTAPTTTPPGEDSDVLLMIRDEGGFAPIEFVLNNPPTYVLLRDGTLISQDVAPGAFPGPLMPAMRQVKLSADTMEDIMVLIEASRLPTVNELTNNDALNIVADAATTVATYWDDEGEQHRISVYALGIGDNLPDDLANLLLLRNTLADATFEGAAGEPFHTDAVIVRVLEGGGFAEFDDMRPWEFSFEPSDPPLLNGFPCLVAEGADADAIKSLLADATQATQWEHETGVFTVLARELMPGEPGCDAR